MSNSLHVGGIISFPSLEGPEFPPLPNAQDVDYNNEEMFQALEAPKAKKAKKANTTPKAPKAKGKAPDAPIKAPKEVPADFVLQPFEFKEGIDNIDKMLIESKMRDINFAIERRDVAKTKVNAIIAGDMYRNKSYLVRKGYEDRFQAIVDRENKRCEALFRSAEMYQAYVD